MSKGDELGRGQTDNDVQNDMVGMGLWPPLPGLRRVGLAKHIYI